MEVVSYFCPHCGAPIEYDAEKSVFHCEFCGNDVPKDEIVKKEGEAVDQEQLSMYHCPSCGAELITDANTAATFCRYCGSPTIVKRNLEGVFQPDLVIPFQISKEKAGEIFKNWCHRGRFTPKGFYSARQIEKITGTYVPFWLFDCDVTTAISGNAKKVRVWRSGDYEYTNTKNYYVQRRGHFSYDYVPADGSSRMDDALMDALEPYQYQQMVPFELPYLSGFAAEKYDKNAKEVFERADARMTQASEGMLRQSMSGYSAVNINAKEKKYTKVSSNYTLLPVWMLRYRYKDQTYTFAVNGQSGKVAGKPPLSKLKLGLWAAGLMTVFYTIITLGGALLL